MKILPVRLIVLFIFSSFSCFNSFCLAANVTYDHRSLIIHGRRKLFLSASIHYPRSVPAYSFEGRYDLVKFVKTVQQAGMYMILRIGPFVAAEYNYGGVPVWLHYIPGSVFRSYSKPFMVENEYQWYEQFYKGGKEYAMWAASMAVSQNTGVPWIMCQQYDAPDPVIDTCNSFYCDQFTPHSSKMPKIWTENWPGWFKKFGAPDPHRPHQDVAFSVARFIQKGLPRNPKWGHLKELHEAIMLCEGVLLNSDPINLSLGPSQEADVYADSTGACAAFLANTDNATDIMVVFRNVSYFLPAWSVSILPDCKNVAFNTAKVSTQTSIIEMVPEYLQQSDSSADEGSKALQWDVFKAMTGIWGEANFVKSGLVDHLNTTKDTTDYLWYTTSIIVNEDEEFLRTGSQPALLIESKGHTLHAFINQELVQGNTTYSTGTLVFNFTVPIPLKAGKNKIDILSMTVGMPSAGPFYEWTGTGLTGVKIKGFNNGTLDLSSYNWTYKIGVQGQDLSIYNPDNLTNVNWTPTSEPPRNQPLTWYKAVVNEPVGDEPIGLDMLHMGKGQAWLNGEPIGRYWDKRSSIDDHCIQECDYRGTFNQQKCLTGCGEPTQRWYHIPRSWFKPSRNILVIFEEKGGDPTRIRFSRRNISSICGLVTANEDGNESSNSNAAVHLKCPKNRSISTVKFASFGTPTGKCGSFSMGDCHDPNSTPVVEKACLNKNKCAIELTEANFNEGLCPDATKKLAVEVMCS
ncbi:Beta-galactosidase 3 [Citrus sinensis]|nr:Beta-galactosidase 3 [Citrus sinensis]